MNDNYEDYQIEEIDIMKYVRRALGAWKTILVWCACGAVFGIIIGYSTPKKYTSTAIVAPELVTRSTAGGLSTLASMAGLNVNNVGMTDAMHPDLYPAIIKSTSFMVGLFDMPVEVEKRDSVLRTTLYDYVLHHTRTPWYAYVIKAPMLFKGMVGKMLSPRKKEVSGNPEGVDVINLTREQEKAVRIIRKSIAAAVEKKTYILNISATLQSPKAASSLANEIVKRLTEFVVMYRTSKAQENVEYYQKLYDESRASYLEIEKEYARYVDTHQGLVLKSVQIEQQHLQNETNLRYQLYNSTAQNLLSAKAKVIQESPVLVTVQPGITPNRGKPSVSKVMLAFAFLAGCVAVVWALWKNRDSSR